MATGTGDKAMAAPFTSSMAVSDIDIWPTPFTNPAANPGAPYSWQAPDGDEFRRSRRYQW